MVGLVSSWVPNCSCFVLTVIQTKLNVSTMLLTVQALSRNTDGALLALQTDRAREAQSHVATKLLGTPPVQTPLAAGETAAGGGCKVLTCQGQIGRGGCFPKWVTA